MSSSIHHHHHHHHHHHYHHPYCLNYWVLNISFLRSGVDVGTGIVVGTENNEVKTNKPQFKYSLHKTNRELPPATQTDVCLNSPVLSQHRQHHHLHHHHHRYFRYSLVILSSFVPSGVFVGAGMMVDTENNESTLVRKILLTSNVY